MVAYVFRTIVAVTGHARAPGPARQIAVTHYEHTHLDATLISRPARDAWHRLRWSERGGVTSTSPAPHHFRWPPENHSDHNPWTRLRRVPLRW
jgi:hypothetical protein